MNKKSETKPAYLKIDQVVLSFEDKPNLAQHNTLYLCVRGNGTEIDQRVRALPIYLDETKNLTLPYVWLSVWGNTEMMVPVISACRAKTQIALPADLPFITQIIEEQHFHLHMMMGHINAIHALEKLNDFAWMQSVEFRPVWYSEELYGEIFNPENDYSLVDYEHQETARVFHSPAFKRGLAADRLLEELDDIPDEAEGATRFHKWVVLALREIFTEDLERVRSNPNGNAPERRDIVATNIHANTFWRRIYGEYKVSMPVFEVKNYTLPSADDFRQVYSYLGHQHHGTLGFIVTRAKDLDLKPSTLKLFREMYRKDRIGKLIIVIPCALLVTCLLDIQFGRDMQPNQRMTEWLEEFLTRHLNE